MIIRRVTRHWILSGKPHAALPTEAETFYVYCLKAPKAIVAYEHGKLVGFLRYNKARALGTWVQPAYRGVGLARALWSRMLELEKPKRFHVTTVSAAGFRFIHTVMPRWPDIDWDVHHHGGN